MRLTLVFLLLMLFLLPATDGWRRRRRRRRRWLSRGRRIIGAVATAHRLGIIGKRDLESLTSEEDFDQSEDDLLDTRDEEESVLNTSPRGWRRRLA